MNGTNRSLDPAPRFADDGMVEPGGMRESSSGMADDPDTTISWLTRVTRFGWLSKGLVFVIMGIIAVRVATTRWEQPDADATQTGALRVVAAQPFGSLLLVAMSLGLAVFTVWNLTQAVIRGSTDLDAFGVLKRIGWFGLGIFYALIAFLGFRLATSELGSPEAGTDSPDTNGSTGDASPVALTARLLDVPGGRVAAIAIALGVVIIAGYHLHKGVTYGFVDDLDTTGLSPSTEEWFGRLGVGGFVARAFVLAVVAFFLAKAAVEFDPNEAVGLDGALREFASVAYGRVVIVFVGVGLAIAGIYDMVTFRRQQLR